MRISLSISILLFCLVPVALAQLPDRSSGVDVQLRGISAVSATTAWASGASGTILRTVDAGKTWEKLSIEGAEKLDFRDIRAFDDKMAYVLSIGPGEQSRIYKTADGGQHWQLQFTNHEPKAFYDCFAFWDRDHGIALSDSVNGQFPLLSTSDGSTWSDLAPQKIPPALPNEGAFAASGTCVATFGMQDAWFVTGGPAARVFHTADRGRTWTVTTTPILSGEPSQGIFSIVFWSARHGVIVGGDYMHPETAGKNAAYTEDGGQTWSLSTALPSGYRSGAAFGTMYDPETDIYPMLVAVGTNGISTSFDGGRAWNKLSSRDYNAVSIAEHVAWVVGSHGRIGRINLQIEWHP